MRSPEAVWHDRLASALSGAYRIERSPIAVDGRFTCARSTDRASCRSRPPADAAPRWGPDSRRVYFRDRDKLVAVDLKVSPGLSISKRTISTGFWATGADAFSSADDFEFDLSPGGRTFVVATRVNATAKVFAAFNWAEELRREFNAGTKK